MEIGSSWQGNWMRLLYPQKNHPEVPSLSPSISSRPSVHHLVHRGLLVPRARHYVLVVRGDVTAQHGWGLLGLEVGERHQDKPRREGGRCVMVDGWMETERNKHKERDVRKDVTHHLILNHTRHICICNRRQLFPNTQLHSSRMLTHLSASVWDAALVLFLSFFSLSLFSGEMQPH